MHLTIISCTPRTMKKSNTDKITRKFAEGVERTNSTVKIFYLAERTKWNKIRQAFYRSNHVMFAIPLFVECVPGIMLEFLDTLQPKEYEGRVPKTKLSFLLQGGFPEASQLRCGEEYLEQLPGYLNCEYAGTLIKGNMFMVSLSHGKEREKSIHPFVGLGEQFAKDECFYKDNVSEFAKPEYFSKAILTMFTLMRPIQSLMFKKIAKSLGCKAPLRAKPYKQYVS